MSETPEPSAASTRGLTGSPESAADLHDAIARHLDGGLDPEGQRALARRLAASAEARRLLAAMLRVEAGLVRLGLAGQFGGAAGRGPHAAADGAETVAVAVSRTTPSAPVTGRRRTWRGIAVDLALAAAAVVALVLAPWWAAGRGGGELDLVATQWLRVARAAGPFEVDETTAVADAGSGDETGDVPSDEPDAGPPAWLMAAMADEEFQRLSPDAG